jgi:hypothetical protein
MRRPRFVAPVVALGALIGSFTACTTPSTPTGGDAPAGLAFYTPPSPLRGSRPGDIQWYRSIDTNLFPQSKVSLVMYRSVDAGGAPMAVTGTVIVPEAPYAGGGARPIVAFAPQTTGITDNCAPSRALSGVSAGGWSETNNLKAALAKGWAVAVTDYQGLGTPGRHTYMVRDAQGHAVLDSARAAVRLEGSGLSADAPVVIWGYSQGGGAAGAAAELAATYAPELAVRGTAAGGVPADLDAVYKALNGGFFGFALAAAQGFDAAYPELAMDAYLTPAGRTELAKLDSATGDVCLWTMVLNYFGQRIQRYATVDLPSLPAWQVRLEQSKLGKVRPSAPVFQYHASLDEVIPLAVGNQLHQRWCAVGADTLYQQVAAEHLTGNAAGVNAAVTYLGNRIAGLPTNKNC